MPDWETAIWPRAEHLQRVFQVRSDNKLGTAFVLDSDGRQYIVSALHVVEEVLVSYDIEIRRGELWVSFVANVVGVNEEADVAVLSIPERPVGTSLDIAVSSAGCAAGQEVFFLGYPLGIIGPGVGEGWPLPLIKRGVVSNFYGGQAPGIYLSASANPGFSGGPVYFADHKSAKATLTAIIIESIAYRQDVFDTSENVIGYIMADSNIVRCCYISFAIDLIATNPTGLVIA